jgi:hypothetical protein
VDYQRIVKTVYAVFGDHLVDFFTLFFRFQLYDDQFLWEFAAEFLNGLLD